MHHLMMDTVPAEFDAKIHLPPAAGHTIRRQRLIDLLHRDLHLGLQLIAAPAGYGKTTLLTDFCSDLDIPVCWYAIDRRDFDPGYFIAGLIASVRLHFPEFGRSSEARATASEKGAPTTGQLADALTRDMSDGIPDYFLLVLEDYHFADGSADFRLLVDAVVARMPENCHLIISSRTAIDLPAVTTRLIRAQASTLTGADLAFSTAEIKELAARHKGPELSDAAIDQLARDTDGWIVGLMLHFSGGGGSQRLDGFPALTREDLFRFLAAEAYQHLPAPMRAFLLKSSVLQQIDPDFCDRLLGTRDSIKLLRSAQRRNLFLSSVAGKPTAYRYHPLFREFLEAEFAETDPVEQSRLHGRAAVMFREDRRWPEAIDHFLAARRYARARDVIREVGQDFLKTGKWLTVSAWIDALPARFRAGDGELLLLQAQTAVHAGRLAEAAGMLTTVIDMAPDAEGWLRRARSLSWRSAAHRLAGNLVEARRDIKSAIALLERNGGPSGNLGDAYRRLGVIYLEQGRLAASLPYFRRALKHCASVFDLAETAAVYNALGTAYRELGDLAKATAHFDFARQNWQKVGNLGALASLLNNLGLVYQCQGDYERALTTLRAALENARVSGYRRTEACVMISIADVLRDTGMFDDALTAYQEGLTLAEEVMEVYYIIWATAGMGETHRLLGAPQTAETLLRQALSQAEVHGRAYESALFSVRLGIIEYERGEYRKALTILHRAGSFLRQHGDKEALARTSFHIAQARFLAREYAEAERALAEAAQLTAELGYDTFLAVEARNAILLLEFAGSRGIGAGQYVRLLKDVRSRAAPRLGGAAHARVDNVVRPQREFEVFGFGDGRVLVNGQRVSDSDWRSGRAREMFFYLVYCDVAQTKEQIAAALWPDLPPARSTSNFHISLFRARHTLVPRCRVHTRGALPDSARPQRVVRC